MSNSIEILAPCKDFKSLYSAINAGANAVYLGLKKLNARSSATNFCDDELKDVVSFCKLRNVKVYLTLNTIFFDDEKNTVIEICNTAKKAGVDGLIIQDFGIFYLLKDNVDIKFYASTQMVVHSLYGAKFLQNIGFTRVVLARELSLEEIKNIVKNTSVETEVFVHGALCMSVSGNCYASSVIGARSGNRGKCAQTCRLPFKLEGESDYTYNLSLKDMSLIDYANEFQKIGVTSLKIEGRMKRAEYVTISTLSLHNKLQGLSYDKDTLKNVFSRTGFTTGYITSNFSNMFGIRKKEDILKQQKAVKTIENIKVQNFNSIYIDFEINIFKETGILVKAFCDNKTYTVCSNFVECSKNKSVSVDDVEKSFRKTGGTIFTTNNINCNIGDNLFVKTSVLNNLRREILNKIAKEKSEIKNTLDIKVNDEIKNIQRANFYFTARFKNFSQIPFSLIDKLKYIYIPIDEVLKNTDILKKFCEKIVVELPYTLFEYEHLLFDKIKRLKNLDFNLYEANNVGHIEILKELNADFIASFRLNIVNSYSCNYFSDLGAKSTLLSIEVSKDYIEKIKSPNDIGIITYGYIPIMTTRVCPIKQKIGCKKCNKKSTLIDRIKNNFIVSCDNEVTYLFNSKPLCLSDKIDDFKNLSFSHLYFTFESKDECKDIIADHLNRVNNFKENCFTRGLYYRKVK